MRVWPTIEASPQSHPALAGADGELVSVSVCVDSRDLEDLLDLLAQLSFPINPQIFHDAAIVYIHNDGREEAEPVTAVEFPAYAGNVPEVRQVLAGADFATRWLRVAGMLDEIHFESQVEPAPEGAAYRARRLIKQAKKSVAAH